MQQCGKSREDKLKCVKILSVKDHNWLYQNLSNMNYLPMCTSRLVVKHPCQVSFKSMQGCRRSWEDKLKCVKFLSYKDHNSANNLPNMNDLPACTSRLVVQHPCQVSFKSMQWCRRSWEDKLKCVKILSVKDHNSAKICRKWIIFPPALLDLWHNICTKFHSNPWSKIGKKPLTRICMLQLSWWISRKPLTACLITFFLANWQHMGFRGIQQSFLKIIWQTDSNRSKLETVSVVGLTSTRGSPRVQF